MARGKIIFTEEQKNFLLSPVAKELKPLQAAVLKPDESYERFKDVRWGWQQGRPYCPWCGHERVYERANRSNFKCAKCGRDFSVTTRTVFASRKMSFTTILRAISMRLHDPKNMLQTSYDLGVAYKTSYRLGKMFRIFGNIQPKVSENRWPYLNSNPGETADLLLKVNAALPRGLPEQVRADVAQDVIVGVLSGEISEEALAADVQGYIRAHYRSMEWRFDTRSLDQPKSGTDGRSWHEFLSDDHERF